MKECRRMLAALLAMLMLLGAACAEAVETDELAAADSALNGEAVRAMLAELNDNDYDSAWEALSSGETIGMGAKNRSAKGLQKLLKALGASIYVDGNAGSKTFAALNEARAARGAAAVETADAACFARLVLWLRVQQSPEDAEALIRTVGLEAGEMDYDLACANLAAGRGYRAAQLFAACGWSDGAARAEECAQPWPATGEIYRAEDLEGRSMQLVLSVQDPLEGQATLAKLYLGGKLVSALFIGPEGRASVRLPGGNYCVHLGTGESWYGLDDAFGDAGSYEAMLFDDGGQTVSLQEGMKYTLTLNDDSLTDGENGVGSAALNLDNF